MVRLGAASDSDHVTVEFMIELPGTVQRVHLLGDFNGWDTSAHPLQSDVSSGANRIWKTRLEVPRDRIFHFCYEIDRQERIPDPDVPRQVPGPGGRRQTLLDTELPKEAATSPLPEKVSPVPPLGDGSQDGCSDEATLPVESIATQPTTGRPHRSSKRMKGTTADEINLAEEVEEVMDDPPRRLQLAAKLFGQARKSKQLHERLLLLRHVTVLDPFELRYRLALGSALRENGRVKEAVGAYRQAQELWPGMQAVALLLGQALLEDGRLQEALDQFGRVGPDGAMGRQAAFDRLEANLRLARSGADWQKVVEELGKIEVDADAVGLFCEKCLKIAVEANEPELTVQLLDLAHRKLGAQFAGHPAYRLFTQVVMFEPESVLDNAARLPTQAASDTDGDRLRLEAFLKAYRLAQAVPTGDGGDRVKFVGAWQRLVERQSDAWPELKDAYLVQLDRWAEEAYKGKKFQLAGLLWNEAERIDPYNPAVLQNLALVYTRQDNEDGQRHYWDRLTRVLNLYCEMAPEADGFSRLLAQKHQAFVEAANKALPTATRWRDLLELAADWAREAVPLLALRQLEFRNPMFQCGIWRDDYRNKSGRERALNAGVNCMKNWLALAAEWAGLPADRSELVKARLQRLERARLIAAGAGPDSRRYYHSEREAFKLHRDSTVQQYLMFVFNVLQQLAEHADDFEATDLARYHTVARVVLAFPHELMKAGAMQLLKGLDKTIDLAQKVQEIALFPWLKKAQEEMEREQFAAAARLYRTAWELAPAFLPALIQLAQCLAAQQLWDEAWAAARDALAQCDPKDKLYVQLAGFLEQMDVARVQASLAKAQQYLKDREPKQAVKECLKALRDYPGHPLVLFILAQARLASLAFDEAHDALLRAAQAARPDSDLGRSIAELQAQFDEYAPQVVFSEAIPLMQDGKWKAAAQVLAKGDQLKQPIARITYYHAICLAHAGDIAGAQAKAQAAIQQSPTRGDDELREEINNFMEQIPILPIQEELKKSHDFMQREQWSDAIRVLRAAQKKVPPALPVLIRLAQCYAAEQQWNKAWDSAGDALKLCSPDEEIHGQLIGFLEQMVLSQAMPLMKAEDWGAAAEVLHKGSRLKPPCAQITYYRAVCLARMGNSDEAEARAREAIRQCRKPKDDELKKEIGCFIEQIPILPILEELKKAQEYMERKKWREAINILTAAGRKVPPTLPVLSKLAQCYAEEQRWDEAWASTRDALELCGTEEEIHGQLTRFMEQMDVARVQQRLDRAQQYLKDQQAAAAVRECRSALDDYPEHPYVLFVLAQALLSEMDFDEAKDALKRAARTAPKDSDLHQSISEFQEHFDDQAPQALLARAVPIMNDENWSAAADVLSMGNRLSPPSARITFYQGVCQARMGNMSKAEAKAREAIRQCRKPKDDELKEEITRFIDQLPMMLIEGDIQEVQRLIEEKDFDQALRQLEHIRRTAPKAAPVYYYRAACLMNLGRTDEARQVARDGLAYASGKANEEIRKQLDSIIAMVDHGNLQQEMNRAVEAMNREDWYSAQGILKELANNRTFLFNSQAKFYLAVCLFRMEGAFMDYSTKRRIKELLTEAKSMCFDKALKKQIEDFERAVDR